jgi:hypothetical protein
MHKPLFLSLAFAASTFAATCTSGPLTIQNPTFYPDVSGWIDTSSVGVTFISNNNWGEISIPSGMSRWAISQEHLGVIPSGAQISFEASISFDSSNDVTDLGGCYVEVGNHATSQATTVDPSVGASNVVYTLSTTSDGIDEMVGVAINCNAIAGPILAYISNVLIDVTCPPEQSSSSSAVTSSSSSVAAAAEISTSATLSSTSDAATSSSTQSSAAASSSSTAASSTAASTPSASQTQSSATASSSSANSVSTSSTRTQESVSANAEPTPSTTSSLPVLANASPFSNSSALVRPTSTSADVGIPTEFPTCPRSHGRIHFSRRKRQYKIRCGGQRKRHEISRRQDSVASKFDECINACDAVSGCQSVLFNPINLACNTLTCVVADVASDLWGADLVATAEGVLVDTTVCPANVLSKITVNTNTTISIENYVYNTMLITVVCCGCTGKCGVQVGVCSTCVRLLHHDLSKLYTLTVF